MNDSTTEKEKKPPENKPTENKPIVNSAKPKTTKPVSEMEPVSESEKNSGTKIIPNRYPFQEDQNLESSEEDEIDNETIEDDGEEDIKDSK